MGKMERIDAALTKARTKAAEWQAKVKELERQRQEEENLQIVSTVRALNMTPAQLAEFLKTRAADAAPITDKEEINI